MAAAIPSLLNFMRDLWVSVERAARLDLIL
jgi:hypothetical protein